MEHSNIDPDVNYHPRITSGSTAYGASTLENASSPLQQRRSNVAMRGENRTQPLPSPYSGMVAADEGLATGGGFGNGTKARKGSIRNAVRKIFGRRSRDVSNDSNPLTSTSRHTYHKSEPTAALPPPQEVLEISTHPENDPAHPPFSDPYPISSPSFNRTVSPYAVQFPNSVKLKPMDLGNPFMSRPAPAQLRRRKTISSLEVAEREAAAIAARLASREPSGAKRGENRPGEPVEHASTRKVSQVKRNRRKSRSADDLRNAVAGDGTPPRKRSEEIRYWRESFQPDVLRASGFAVRRTPEVDPILEQASPYHQRSPQQEELGQHEESRQLPLVSMDNFSLPSRTGTFRSSPPIRHRRGKSGSTSVGESDMLQSSAIGTEMSKDLEDRVAKLESGLQNFQRSLQRLTADRNRRTVIMGNISTKRSSTDMRTPSLLADTLADALDPSSYQSYSYEQTALRPSTSPQQAQPEPQPQFQPPPQMSRRSQPAPMEDPFGPEPAAAPPLKLAVPAERPTNVFHGPSPLSSHPPTQQLPAIPSSSSTTATPARTQQQPYTFNSLYQMLADERSARRKLESQLKGLQQEISDLHSQVALSSNVQSTRSSYMLAGSSTRLQELLRETEESSPPPAVAARSQRDSDVSSAAGGGSRRLDPIIVSRFSASESEAGTGAADYDELATPYEAYRTPREERSAYSLASKVDDGEMF